MPSAKTPEDLHRYFSYKCMKSNYPQLKTEAELAELWPEAWNRWKLFEEAGKHEPGYLAWKHKKSMIKELNEIFDTLEEAISVQAVLQAPEDEVMPARRRLRRGGRRRRVPREEGEGEGGEGEGEGVEGREGGEVEEMEEEEEEWTKRVLLQEQYV